MSRPARRQGEYDPAPVLLCRRRKREQRSWEYDCPKCPEGQQRFTHTGHKSLRVVLCPTHKLEYNRNREKMAARQVREKNRQQAARIVKPVVSIQALADPFKFPKLIDRICRGEIDYISGNMAVNRNR